MTNTHGSHVKIGPSYPYSPDAKLTGILASGVRYEGRLTRKTMQNFPF